MLQIQNYFENYRLMFILILSVRMDVPEVLNVHVNERKKKSTFFRKIFFSSSQKLTFEKDNIIFLNIF